MSAVPNCVRLPIAVDASGLAADAAQFDAADWIPHFNTGYYEGDWSGVALRSIGGIAGQLYPDPTAGGDYADTPLLDRCPHVREVLAAMPAPHLSVRFLRLGPGAAIREHSDLNLGLDDGEVRLHTPVTTSPDVEFLVATERVAMKAGEVWYLDLNKKHAVTNRGTDARVHLVVDCVVNDWLRDLIVSAARQPPRP